MAKENLTDFEREFEKQASRYYNYNGPDDLYAIRECSKKLMQKAKEELMTDAVECEVTETCGISSIWIKTTQFKPGQKVRIIVCKKED